MPNVTPSGAGIVSPSLTVGVTPVVNSTANYLLYADSNGALQNISSSSISVTITVNSTAISGGTSGRVLYDNAGTVGELTTTGSGSVVLQASPTLTGNVGFGSAANASDIVTANAGITGATSSRGINVTGAVQSDVTSLASYYRTSSATQAAAFTLSTLNHYVATQGTFGAGSTVTNQYGFVVDASLTGATNNYGFYSSIASGSNRWNFYGTGTANNYMAGALGIGATSLTGYSVRLAKTMTGSTTSLGFTAEGVVQSDVTTTGIYYQTIAATQATAFTTDLKHYRATQGTIGAGSTVTNQYGFIVESSLTGATNNYGFYSNIASGSNRWGFYANGTAANRFNSDLTIYGGTAIPAGGTAGSGYKFSSTSNFGIFFGSGAPTLSAAKGSLYLRSDGTTTNDRAYINTDGSTTWTALTTAA